MALKDYEIQFFDLHATAIVFAPVCQKCNYIFNLDDVKVSHVRDPDLKILPHCEISPNICPQCGKNIEAIIVPDLASALSESK